MTRVGLAVHRTFHSLHTRNFRLYFIGQVVSVTGTWLNATASAWLVLRLSNSGFALGLNTALTFLPILLVGAFGGMLADRYDKRKILISTQAAYAILALTLFVLAATDVAQLWMVYALSLGAGLVTALDNPTRQSFYMELVPEDDLTNAVSLNSAVFMGARIVGASAAALVITTIGLANCFLIDALSYVAVIGALLAMRTKDLHGRQGRRTGERGSVREGFRYVWNTPELRRPLVLMTIVFTFAFNWAVLLPLLAKRTFGGDAATFGIMSALTGAGAFVAALIMANRSSRSSVAAPDFRRLSTWSIASGMALLFTAFAPTLGVAYLSMLPLGLHGHDVHHHRQLDAAAPVVARVPGTSDGALRDGVPGEHADRRHHHRLARAEHGRARRLRPGSRLGARGGDRRALVEVAEAHRVDGPRGCLRGPAAHRLTVRLSRPRLPGRSAMCRPARRGSRPRRSRPAVPIGIGAS